MHAQKNSKPTILRRFPFANFANFAIVDSVRVYREAVTRFESAVMSVLRKIQVTGLLALVAFSFGGCDASAPEVNPKTEAQFKVLGILYGKYMGNTRGKPPANAEQFLDFLKGKKPSWEKIVNSAEQLLVSPRDNEPLKVLYGEDVTKQRQTASPWIAYEQSGVDGMRQVVSVRGGLKLMDDAELQSVIK